MNSNYLEFNISIVFLLNFLYVIPIKEEIWPFAGFDSRRLEWFSVYSKDKHNKLELIKNWNMKHALYSLGALLLLVMNHPSVESRIFNVGQLTTKVFDLLSSKPRFCKSVIKTSI